MIQAKEILENEVKKWGKVLQSFPKGEMGLTPDSVRNTPEFKEAKSQYNYWFNQMKKFNAVFFKTHKHAGFEYINGKRISIYKPIKVKA